ncbi:MAG: tRNA (N6-isopentenyl adenosine(37)-C2)-methylthiotransferase MiaB [Candidatus Omnitrophica bacterium]|nr:tRNA (N6-isopentenyl adenosine(37)-C2)-methylthiotransferase MiaB [Candidatus Omnitrophota bacterium]
MNKMKISLQTFGCQMNEYDTQVASGLLEHDGYQMASDESTADVFIMNTCSVREHAEDKVYSRLGKLSKIKKTKPEMIIGLMGCMVEEHKEKLFKRFPELDLMVGTRNMKELPALIEEVKQNRKQVARIKQDGISIEYTDLIKRDDVLHAWLPIMTGCDKVCTYCIVPITRGREVSMPSREVYREASRLVNEGVKHITLLGQNVNSYNDGMRFPELLEMLCGIEALERISFTTSHPHDATEELFQAIARYPKISRRFHLPLQSGSDRILKRMKRLHTYADYKTKIDRLRRLVPEISVTTDIITGFSGESEEDHEATKRALREIRYDSAFIFKYSPRSGTPAAKLPDDVPMNVKKKRHHELLEIQKQITRENNRAALIK